MKGPYLVPETRERVLMLVGNGKYIHAIKVVRELTGLGLKDAKDYVDSLKSEAYARAIPPDVQGRARGLLAEGRRKDAVKMVRRETGLDSRGAKDFIGDLESGRLPVAAPAAPPGAPPMAPEGGWASGALSDRVRAMKSLGDHESAIAVVRAETGMSRDEARRFVEALG